METLQTQGLVEDAKYKRDGTMTREKEKNNRKQLHKLCTQNFMFKNFKLRFCYYNSEHSISRIFF